MKVNKLAAAVFAAICVCCCANVQPAEPCPASPVTLKAVPEHASKTTIAQEGWHVSWSEGDTLAVTVNGAAEYKFGKCPGENLFSTPSAEFASAGQGSTISAFYPYSAYDNGLLTIPSASPLVQRGAGDKAHLAGLPLAGSVVKSAEDLSIPMKQLCAIIGVRVANNSTSELRVTAVDLACDAPGVALNGTFAVDPATLSLTPAAAASEMSISVSGVSLAPGCTGVFYIPCAAFTVPASSKLAISVHTDKGSELVEKTGQELEFRAGEVRHTDVALGNMAPSLFDEDNIAASFAVVSDVHINTGSSATSAKWKACLQQYKSRCELDAVLVAGDLIDNPNSSYLASFKQTYESELDPTKVPMIYAVGNHDVPSYRWSSSMVSDAAYIRSGLGANYFLADQDKEAGSGMECRHCVVGQYNILCISPNGTQPIVYAPAAISWLDTKLAQLTEAEPEKYVIVLTHPMISDTVYGSLLGQSSEPDWAISSVGYWATTALTQVLEKYPQVVTFGGHLHFPLNDPRSQWQGKFTVMGCASVRYMALENGGYENMAGATTMQDKDEFSQGNLLQFDTHGNMRLTRMDFYNSSAIEQPIDYGHPAADGSHLHTSSHAEMALVNKAPVMSGAEVECVPFGSSSSCTVKWQAAADDMFAHHYLVQLYKDGVCQSTRKVLADFYRHPRIADMKQDYSLSLGSLPAGDYEVYVFAVDSWGLSSNAAKCSFCVAKQGASGDMSVYVDIDFGTAGAADVCGNASIVNVGGAPISLLQLSHAGHSASMYGVTLNGSSYLSATFSSISTRELMADFAHGGFSVEAFYVDKAPGSAVHGIVCATEMGGWGIANRATNVPYFIVGDNAYNKYRSVDATAAASKTELTHVVAVYDYASRSILIYLNGKYCASQSITGPFYPGKGDSFNRFIIGGDTKDASVAGDFPPSNMVVVDAKIYSAALTAEQVAAIYSDAVKSISQ